MECEKDFAEGEKLLVIDEIGKVKTNKSIAERINRCVMTEKGESVRIFGKILQRVNLANHCHTFSRSFYAQTFGPRCHKRFFNHTFDQSHYPNGMIACDFTSFGSLALLKNIPLVATGIRSTFYSIDSYHTLKISLNYRNQTNVSSLQGFSKNPYTPTFFCHHTVIYSLSN